MCPDSYKVFKFFLPNTFKDTAQPLGYINSCGGDSNGKQQIC